MATNTLSIIDLKAKKWLTSVILDTPQKGAANPWSVIVTPDDKQIIVAAAGRQELVRIDREKGRVRWVPREVKFIQPIIIHRNWCLWI